MPYSSDFTGHKQAEDLITKPPTFLPALTKPVRVNGYTIEIQDTWVLSNMGALLGGIAMHLNSRTVMGTR